MFTVASARADTYSWTNFQSDIPGVAQHVDPNLVNPWGMAASATSSNGVIWVSDNGTGVSTLYRSGWHSAIRSSLRSQRPRGTEEIGNPTGIVSTPRILFK